MGNLLKILYFYFLGKTNMILELLKKECQMNGMPVPSELPETETEYVNDRRWELGTIENGFFAYHKRLGSSFWSNGKTEPLRPYVIVGETKSEVLESVLWQEFKNSRLSESDIFGLFKRVEQLKNVICESNGVIGYHNNGDIATWEECGLE